MDSKEWLSAMLRFACEAADLLMRAVCRDCHSCVSLISDINRQVLLELAEAEGKLRSAEIDERLLNVIYAVGKTVNRAFSVAMLLPEQASAIGPLEQVVICHKELADLMNRLCQPDCAEHFSFLSFTLCANKGRGAHALLLQHTCSTEEGRCFLPLFLALEAHRNSLEDACIALVSYCGNC